MAAYDLRNPLVSIRALTNLLRNDTVELVTPKQRDLLDTAYDASQSMLELLFPMGGVTRIVAAFWSSCFILKRRSGGLHPITSAPRSEYDPPMTTKIFLVTAKTGLVTMTVLMAALTGCVYDGPNQRGEYRGRPTVQVQAAVVFQDDYDYYPAYETYYSRNRHEYVYRDGNNWVRSPQPRGIQANVLLAAPSVRVDFHDSPAQHHSSVVKSYPKNWKQPAKAHADKNERKDDKKPSENRN